MAKVDCSMATFMVAHNSIGASVIEILGSEEQKQRMIPQAIQF